MGKVLHPDFQSGETGLGLLEGNPVIPKLKQGLDVGVMLAAVFDFVAGLFDLGSEVGDGLPSLLVLDDALLGLSQLLPSLFDLLEAQVHDRLGAAGLEELRHPLVEALAGLGKGAQTGTQAGAVDYVAYVLVGEGVDGLEFCEAEAVEIPVELAVGAAENLLQGVGAAGLAVGVGEGDLATLWSLFAFDRDGSPNVRVQHQPAAGTASVEGRVGLIGLGPAVGVPE